MQKKNKLDYKKIASLLGMVGIVIFTVICLKNGIFTNQDKMNRFLENSGMFAPLLFVLIQAVQVVLPILPGAVGCLYGVIFWGAVKGFFYNYIGICLGSFLAFLIARHWGKRLVIAMTGGKFYEKYGHYLLTEKRFEIFFAIMIFLPVAPDDFLCYLAGISHISIKKFIAIILLGKPLAILMYSMGLHQIFQLILQWIG